ncbi:MAG: alkaline phosphatase [Synechococcaceae cyanobacterium SM2_3_60]|nr:alkaline phosphatase [Synechococcaceae cyanobacterium SM2_3_60]
MLKITSKLASALAISLLFAACTPSTTTDAAAPAEAQDATSSESQAEPVEAETGSADSADTDTAFVAHSLLAPDAAIEVSVLGHYQSGVFDEGAAEIVAYDSESQRGFVINAAAGQVDVFDLSDPSQPTLVTSVDASELGGGANSISFSNGIAAIALAAEEPAEPGVVAFIDTEGELLTQVTVGALPDALTWSPDGRYVVVVNEGEPSDDYTVDPEGSVSIIDVSGGIESLSQDNVRTADFQAFNGREEELREQGIRIYGPNASAAQDFEPEWAEVTADSTTAYVSLQENNAIAIVDIESATVTNVFPLGYKNWLTGNAGLDASDEDSAITIQNWPVLGAYQPDTIRLYEQGEATFIITANEGDSRDYDTFSEEYRIGDEEVTLAADAFPDAEVLKDEANLGRLRLSTAQGYRPTPECVELVTTSGDPSQCEFEALYVFGGRSMSIFQVSESGLEQVFDTGSQMEQTVAELLPDNFNTSNDENDSFDGRSDDKGPEPEGIAVGEIDGRTYAFVGLERVGGVMVYDITEPASTTFVQYINNRDFNLEDTPEALTTTDLGAEGLYFIPASDSPNGQPLLMVGNEVSGTTTVFAINSLN